MIGLRLATVLALLPATALAQTANGSPTAPASPGLVGTPAPISRTPPTVGRGTAAAPGVAKPLPKPTAAERAEQKKLDRDLNICTGC